MRGNMVKYKCMKFSNKGENEMSGIKNKIITISGEPVSGKSTVVKMLKEKYEKMGYKIHIVATGHVFRDRAIQEYTKMYPDRTDANLADIQEDETFAEKRAEIDIAIDRWVEQLGKEINREDRPNDVYIIDSRLAWHNIPDSYAVRLTVDEKIAGKRVFSDSKRGIEDRYDTVEEAIEKTRQRKIGEISRYKKRYGVNLDDPENYDLIVDTSYSNTEELADIIIDGEKSYRGGTYYPKMWASPACFIGTQTDRQTCSASGMYGYRPEELAEIMKRDGYKPELGEIVVLENYGEKFVQDGHHRAIAVLAMGKTLTPYRVNKDPNANKNMEKDQNNVWFAYDWSDCISYYGGTIGKQKQFENFSVKDLTAYEHRIKPMIDEMTRKSQEGR